MQEIDYAQGLTPKQATISGIELIPSRYGGWIYDVKFDNGWRCYVDPNNRNWHRWQQICEDCEIGITLGKLRAKNKHKRIYNADSPFVRISERVMQMVEEVDRMCEDNLIEIVREKAIEYREMLWLKGQIEHAEDMPNVEVVQMPDDNLYINEMHIKDQRSLYIIPIALPY